MIKKITELQSKGSISLFIKAVGSYFMEFLETDFHKRKLPRRSIKLHNDKGLLSGINLSRYPSFYKTSYKLINNCFNGDILSSIQKGVYKADIPKALLDLIKKQINIVSDGDVSKIIKELIESIQQATLKYKDDYMEAFNSVMIDADSIFKKIIILNLVKSIEKSLENNKLADENAIFQIEEELTGIFKNKIEDTVSESLKQLLSDNKSNIKKLFKDALDVEDVRISLTKFFDMFKVSDLFNDVHDLYQNFKIEDKQEFYFYFYDISYQKNKYPIFYIPFSIERKGDVFLVSFDAQIYINKKALAYIVQEYNLESGKKGSLQTIDDRIIYLADHEKDLTFVLQETLTDITNLFGLTEKIQINNPDIQTSKNLYISVSTNIYIALFDKSDEALLNDYEDILNAPEGSPLLEGFQVLIEDFIDKNPTSIQMSVFDEWGERTISEKLVSKSPIPLNSEQRQIILAINNDNCKYVLVEGPPGTGKSHTITAIVFDTILQDKSVLVLSDKKEALDVVEKNIVNTLNKVRVDEKFQNPILRLGKTGNTYGQLLTQSSINGITEQFLAVRSKYPKLNEQIDATIHELKNDLDSQIEVYKTISLEDVNELVSLKNHFEKEGFCIDVNEAIDNPNSVKELEKIRSVLMNLKSKTNDNFSFNFNFKKNLDSDSSENLEAIVTELEDISRLIIENSYFSDYKNFEPFYSIIINNRIEIKRLIECLNDASEIIDIFLNNENYLEIIGFKKSEFDVIDETKKLSVYTLSLNNIFLKVKHFSGNNLYLLKSFDQISELDLIYLEEYINDAKKLKNVLFGYLGKDKQIDQLKDNFKKRFPFSKFENPHKSLKDLDRVLSICKYILELKESLNDVSFGPDYLNIIVSLLSKEGVYFSDEQLTRLDKSAVKLSEVEKIIENFDNRKLSLSTFEELKNIVVASEIDSMYEIFLELINTENDLISSNIDIERAKEIEVFFEKKFINKLIGEFKCCKEYVDLILEINEDMEYLQDLADRHVESFMRAGIDSDLFSSLYNNKLTQISDLEFDKLLRFITLYKKLTYNFGNIKDLNYGDRSKQIENIVTMQMTYAMDQRFVDFTNTYKADAKTLRLIINHKKQFPKEQFIKLKSAFPCILAGIRDYAEYIPLEPEIFDLVIIDEASQVSIAQAFPALLRAKKVVVLGDSLQFSNVKSALARGDINKQYLSNLEEVFTRNVSSETDKIERLGKFNIKVSVLDFMGFINNYRTSLKKHFRGYRELISYSNKFFYKGDLQVMKVRAVPVSSVIKFSQVKHDGLEELSKNTNTPEINFIISELKLLKDQDKKCSVGIITPHTNQQSLLYEKISNLPEADYFFDILKLKIMTFDTCQGEEMDIIFYSMVATENDDKLNYIFINDLNSIDRDDDEGKIKAQRLNVGLSRAKECMHFVLSKPVDKYVGTTREFLQHYTNVLLDGQKELDSTTVDKKSKMEPLVLTWFYQTKFWEENKNNAEIMPQFELGKYLKELDKSYNHPNYRVDFLLVYHDNDNNENKIIIEYDGFLEHFGKSLEMVNGSNYEEYYSPEDVYRQNVLEGYGYKFIRINKFNLGEDPVSTLDFRIQKIVKKKI